MVEPPDLIHKGDILIVDDTPVNLHLLLQMLTEQGYHVRAMPNGNAALTAVQAALPDLILLDIRMPEMDGYAVSAHLKADERTRDIPIIFLSALDDMSTKLRAFGAGGIDYITKPFQPEEVLARVKTHLTLQGLRHQLLSRNQQLQQEIQERRQAEVEREAWAALLYATLESTADGIVVLDKQQKIQVCNQRFLSLWSLPENWKQMNTMEIWSRYIIAQVRNPEALIAWENRLRYNSDNEGQILVQLHCGRWMEISSALYRISGDEAAGRVWTFRDVTARKQAEEAEIVAAERQRLAQETHDGLLQTLAGLRFQVRQWHQWVDTDPARMHAELDELRSVLDGAIVDMRRSIFAMRPIALDELGFFPGLQKLVSDLGYHYQLRVKMEVQGDGAALPAALELPLFRVIQEALYNVGKHARAQTAWVELDFTRDDGVRATVRDDGCGFDPAQTTAFPQQGHWGLVHMRERITQARGTLEISSGPSQGTTIVVTLPWK